MIFHLLNKFLLNIGNILFLNYLVYNQENIRLNIFYLLKQKSNHLGNLYRIQKLLNLNIDYLNIYCIEFFHYLIHIHNHKLNMILLQMKRYIYFLCILYKTFHQKNNIQLNIFHKLFLHYLVLIQLSMITLFYKKMNQLLKLFHLDNLHTILQYLHLNIDLHHTYYTLFYHHLVHIHNYKLCMMFDQMLM